MDNRNIIMSSSSSSASSFDSCSDRIDLLRNSVNYPVGVSVMLDARQGEKGLEGGEFVEHQCLGSKKMNPKLAKQVEEIAENDPVLSKELYTDCGQSSSSERLQQLESLDASDSTINSSNSPCHKTKHKKEISRIHCAAADHRVPLKLKQDLDLQQLENSIKYFDLNNPTMLLSNSTQSLSYHYNGNHNENLDKHISLKEPVDKRRTFLRSLSTGMIIRKERVGSGKLLSAPRLSWLDCQEAKVVCASYTDENDDSLNSSKSIYRSSKSSPTGSWKSIRACGKEIAESVVWRNKDLGPDELSRYLEKVKVNENYIGNSKFSQSSVDGTLDNTAELQILTSPVRTDIPFIIDWVEVVGIRQGKDSSMWERMVGVREHIVYCIKVVSGLHQWEVLKKYRDFVDFYHQLKRIFNHRTGEPLPMPALEAMESHKHFSNKSSNADVRRLQIEKCLQSLLKAGPPFSITPPLFWFLRPPQSTFADTGFEGHIIMGTNFGSSSALNVVDSLRQPQPRHMQLDNTEITPDRSHVGIIKNAKLILNLPLNKPLKQLLSAQNFSCSDCYKHLELGKGIIQGFAQTLARGKPRYCEYTGQLFCSACHLNDLAVIPAHVLRHWDFAPRRVSQRAKCYLDSIYDQPLLDIASVNSYLYLRVPILHHVRDTRNSLSRVLSCIRCHVHGRIHQTMGSRRYLLENNDFFALRELEDISKGPFSVLPGLLDAILRKLVEHVSKECSVCRDTGEWCGAGILCKDPFCPIFPFQEGHVTSCKTCNAPFHKKCFVNTSSCTACPRHKDPEQSEPNLMKGHHVDI